MKKEKIPFWSDIMDALAIVKLEEPKMREIAAKKGDWRFCGVVLGLPFILNLVLSGFIFPSGFGAIFGTFVFWGLAIPILSLIGMIYAMSYLAKKFFGGKGEVLGFFRVVCYASILLWLTVGAYLLGALGLMEPLGLANLIIMAAVVWLFVVAFKMLLFYHKLSNENAAIVIGLGVLIFFVIKGVLGSSFIGVGYRLFY